MIARRVDTLKIFHNITSVVPISKTLVDVSQLLCWVSRCKLHTTCSTKCRTETLSSFVGGYSEGNAGKDERNDEVVSWTTEVSNWVRKEQPVKALSVFRSMVMCGVMPNYITVLSVVKAAGVLNDPYVIEGVHGRAVKMGMEAESSVITALISVYSVYDLVCAWRLFDQMESKDVVSWSMIVSVCAKNEFFVDALEFFREMQNQGVEPNQASVVSVLPACANLGTLTYGKQIHGYALKRLLGTHTNVQNSLIDMYAKCRHLLLAFRVFDRIVTKNLVSWRTMMHGCVRSGLLDNAVSIYNIMCVSSLVQDETLALDLVKAMPSGLEDIRLGCRFHGYLIKSGFIAFMTIRTALLGVYGQTGDVNSARMIFDHIVERDVIAWSAMISVYAQFGDPLRAFNLYQQMLLSFEIPNEVTLASLIKACMSLGEQDVGDSIHAYVTKAGYMSNNFIRSAFIELYCKFGQISQGKTIFDEAATRDLICWSSMINGYGMNGCGLEALETFEKMLDNGIIPNDVVLVSVLSACSHSRLDYDAWFWFDSMEVKFGISPRLPHYGCMVDLLCRQGNIEEAFEFVKCMPVSPDKRIWGAILSCCKSSPKSAEIMENVAAELIALDPDNTSYYVSVANVYAEQGKWADVERLRDFVADKGLKKSTGYSSLETGRCSQLA